jgi:hypothetical protein
MVSEDSDQVVSGLPPVHRLRDLGDLDETVDLQMTTGGNELDTPRELLEVLMLRSPHRVLPEERDNRLQQIRAAPHHVSMQVLPMIVVSGVDQHLADTEELAERMEGVDTRRPCVTANSCATW